MATGISGLIETIMSLFVEAGGYGAVHGGKGVLLAGARKIGWASGGSGGRRGGRFGGHRLAGHRLGNGFGGSRSLQGYSPKSDYRRRSRQQYEAALRSGTGLAKGMSTSTGRPQHLFGRSGFEAPGSPLGRSSSRYTKQPAPSRTTAFAGRPRGFIKY